MPASPLTSLATVAQLLDGCPWRACRWLGVVVMTQLLTRFPSPPAQGILWFCCRHNKGRRAEGPAVQGPATLRGLPPGRALRSLPSPPRRAAPRPGPAVEQSVLPIGQE